MGDKDTAIRIKSKAWDPYGHVVPYNKEKVAELAQARVDSAGGVTVEVATTKEAQGQADEPGRSPFSDPDRSDETTT